MELNFVLRTTLTFTKSWDAGKLHENTALSNHRTCVFAVGELNCKCMACRMLDVNSAIKRFYSNDWDSSKITNNKQSVINTSIQLGYKRINCELHISHCQTYMRASGLDKISVLKNLATIQGKPFLASKQICFQAHNKSRNTNKVIKNQKSNITTERPYHAKHIPDHTQSKRWKLIR